MNIFAITAVGQQELSVFARSYDEAVGIYMLYWFTNHQAELPDIEVKRRNPSWPGLDAVLLTVALNRGVSGIGRLDPDLGWVIQPANHRDEVQA